MISTVVLANRSDIDLGRQVTAPGATWLDHRLVERAAMPLALGGFGREARDAMLLLSRFRSLLRPQLLELCLALRRE